MVKFSRNGEQGFTTAWMLGLVLLVFLIGGVFYDFSGALTQRQKLIAAADRATNAGATALDEDRLISSDGADVVLRTGPPSPDPDFETAVQRCENVFLQEQAKSNSTITSFACNVDAAQPSVVTAEVVGTVSYGVIADWLGKSNQDFVVRSRARPSCSDATDRVSGAC